MESKTNVLADFSWDDDWTPEQVFEAELGKTQKDQQEPKEEPKEEPADDPFEDITADENPIETEEEEEAEEEESKEDIDIFTATAKDLKELGLVGEFEGKLDAQSFLDLVEESIEQKADSSIEQIIENWKSQLGDLGTEFVRYTMNGGKAEDFLTKLAKPKVDISSEYGQEKFVREFLMTEQGMEQEDVDDLIERYKDNDSLEKYAKKYYQKIKEREDRAKEEILEQQERIRQQRDQAIRAFNERLRETAKATDSIKIKSKTGDELGEITFTPTEKRSLVSYITQNNVEQGGRYISEFTAAFNELYQKQPDKLLLIAKLIKNDFDLSDFVKAKATKQVKEIKNNLQRVQTKKTTKGHPSRLDKPVWEIFN